MPPKPAEMKKSFEYYNIDFSLNNQLRLAGAPTAPSTGQSPGQCSLIWKYDIDDTFSLYMYNLLKCNNQNRRKQIIVLSLLYKWSAAMQENVIKF